MVEQFKAEIEESHFFDDQAKADFKYNDCLNRVELINKWVGAEIATIDGWEVKKDDCVIGWKIVITIKINTKFQLLKYTDYIR